MNDLNKYVDSLFINYKKDKTTIDLKEEILSNLEAKRIDYLSQGMDETEALKKVKSSLTSIDGLVEDSKLIYMEHFKTERLQLVIMYMLIGWILTIPMLFLYQFTAFYTLFFLVIVIVGIIYIRRTRLYRDKDTLGFIRINSYKNYKKAVWLLWTLFFIVRILLITGLNFGSNIWFSRPVHINGPYQFVMIALQYYIPVITVIIPIAFSHIYSTLLKNEASEGD